MIHLIDCSSWSRWCNNVDIVATNLFSSKRFFYNFFFFQSDGGKPSKEEVSLNLNDFPRKHGSSHTGHSNNQDRIVEEQNGHDFSPDVPRSRHHDNTLSVCVSSPNQTSNSCSSNLVTNQNKSSSDPSPSVTSAIVTISNTPVCAKNFG